MTLAARVARTALFVACFSLDVNVRASEHGAAPVEVHGAAPAAHGEAHEETKKEESAKVVEKKPAGPSIVLPLATEPQEVPTACVKSKTTCAVGTIGGERYELKLKTATVVLDQNTSIVRVSATELRLLEGTIWVQSDGSLDVTTEFGKASIIDQGEIWVTRKGAKMTIAATRGVAQIQARGSDEILNIDPGFENSIGRVDFTGQATTGIPTALSLGLHLSRWAKLYSKGVKSFEEDSRKVALEWADARERAAAIHAELYQRRVASLQADEDRRREANKAREADARTLRDFILKRSQGL